MTKYFTEDDIKAVAHDSYLFAGLQQTGESWINWYNRRISLLTPSGDVQDRAKGIELFKRLWYNRNPVHERNADNGEDMFWGTAELVAREYAQHLAGHAGASGMRWVPEPFLQVLQDNWQTQIAGYYNVDKTDADRAKRQAVIDEYKDLIEIYKNGSWRMKHESGASDMKGELEALKAENERLRKYLRHLPTCNINQNWDEALQALADTPQQFRDDGYYSALKEIEDKRRTCTCGLNQ